MSEEMTDSQLIIGDQKHKKLMSEIEEKANSENKEDIIESLDLFEAKWQNLPYRPALDFINRMTESEDPQIREKAENVYANYLKKHDEIVRKDLEQISERFRSIVLPIQSQMRELSQAYDVSKQMAEIAKTMQGVQYKVNSLPKMNFNLQQLVKSRNILTDATRNILNTQKLVVPLLLEPSPILRAENLFSKIPDEELEQRSSFSDILEKREEEIAEEIKFISEKEYDFTFNYPAYKLLCNLEVYFRYLIQKIIIEPNNGNLENKIPVSIIDKWKQRKVAEESNPIVDSGYELIYYSDFTDIKEILQKGKNFRLFEDIFKEEQLKIITSKLHELDPIRKKIAHYRPLSRNEFERLRLYTDDILPELNTD